MNQTPRVLKFTQRYRMTLFALVSFMTVGATMLVPIGPDLIQHAQAASDSDINFSRDIKPIFVENCYKCHGPDKNKAKLRLSNRKAALAGGESGPVILPGKADKSLLIEMVKGLRADEIMPPKGKGDRLTHKQIELLTRWINSGAHWPQTKSGGDHWAFAPHQELGPPKVKRAQWVRNPIDNFVLATLESKNLSPSPEADRYTLIKRLYYDLLGFPPSEQQVNAFINDRSKDGYQKLVKQLLQSPHFGERWARHWLDKARYADSDGYEKDRPRNNAWRYRDWVIDAINKDMPFDQFTIEQLAGDLLPNATPMQKLATAFHRQTLTNTEGGTDKEQFRVEAVFDRVETTATVWLGMTMLCARCHTHKYDAITQAEYYQLFAFFDNGDETNTGVPTSAAAVAKYAGAKIKHDQLVKESQVRFDAYKMLAAAKLTAWEKKIQQKLALTSKDAIRFHPLEIVKITGPKGVKFKKLADESILVSGSQVDKAEYTVTVKTATRNITGVRIDVLADPSLPAKGPGRAPNGNFVLSELRLYATNTSNIQAKHKVNLKSAKSNYNQKKFPATSVYDKKNNTGWAVGGKPGSDHWAYFTTDRAIDFKGASWLQIVLDQQYGGKHTIGRFKLQAMTGLAPGSLVPQNIRKILATAPPKRDKKQADTLLDYYLGSVDAQGRKLKQQLDSIIKKAPKKPNMSVRVIAQRSSPRKTKILHRGDFLDPKQEVKALTLSVLPPMTPRRKDAMPDRLDLANWLTNPRNPLPSRVVVNQMWDKLFGQGLVTTLNDFGVRGDLPTHPVLLDWLARQFILRKWSRKKMIELIVNSATYRQSSKHRADLAQIDPQNKLLHRQNRFRVEAEIVRDLNLSIAGLLSKKIGGPSVFPPLPKGIAALSYANSFKWKESKGPDRYRRGMYTFFKRTAPHPNLITFDCPDSNVTSVKRTMSNTPLQALATLNNEVFFESAQGLANRVLTHDKVKTDDQRIKYAFGLCVARPPTQVETTRFTDLLKSSRLWYMGHTDDAKNLASRHVPKGVATEEIAAWVATCRIMLNMDELLTRE